MAAIYGTGRSFGRLFVGVLDPSPKKKKARRKGKRR